MPLPSTTLETIQTKVRRLTHKLDENALTDDDLNNYINTFVLYDFPEHLRMFLFNQTFTFVTNPYQSEYGLDMISYNNVTTNPLYNFQNLYLTVNPPVFIGGYNSLYTQSRSEFLGIYPKVNSIAQTGFLGDGATTTFSGVINTQGSVVPANLSQNVSLLQNNVLFDSLDSNYAGLSLMDVPVVSTATGYNTSIGNLYVPGQLPTTPPTVVNPNNFINYVTGAYTITFPTAPGANQQINSQTVPVNVSIPQALLYFGNKFSLRPVPDQVYRVEIEVFARPTALLSNNQSPQLEEYWQYIAYGAAKKVFEDQMDDESVAKIMPEFKKQALLVLRRTIVQNTNQSVYTIFKQQGIGNNGWNGWGSGGGSF